MEDEVEDEEDEERGWGVAETKIGLGIVTALGVNAKP